MEEPPIRKAIQWIQRNRRVLLFIVLPLFLIVILGLIIFKIATRPTWNLDNEEPTVNFVAGSSFVGGLESIRKYGFTTNQFNQIVEGLTSFFNGYLPEVTWIKYVPDSYRLTEGKNGYLDQFEMSDIDHNIYTVVVDRTASLNSVSIAIYDSSGQKIN